jgi:hypothetical protein
MNGVNLIPMYRREVKARKARVVKWSLAVGAYLALLVAGYMLLDRYATDNSQSLNSQSRRASAELGGAHRLVQAMGQELTQTSRKLQTVQEIGGQPDWGALLAVISKNTSENIALNYCRMERSSSADSAPKAASPAGDIPTVLELGGVAKVQADVSDYVLQLEKLGLFEKVKMVKTSREMYLGQEAVGFRLECVLQGQAS